MKSTNTAEKMESCLALRPEAGALNAMHFDNRFVRDLPADPSTENVPRQVQRACYSRVLPTPVTAPKRVAYSPEVAELLGLSEETCRSETFAEVFTGNRLLPDMAPYATCYGGHQFGRWAGQLGDGRAINLGEVVNDRGDRWTLQLKGAGPTPYRRMADGLAVLRSSVREFLASEAMFHLGVPTTRALSLTLTGEKVMRDMFYDGHPAWEQGAVVCRVAPSFTRFGHFQMVAARKEMDVLKRLAEYTLRTDFPHLGEPSPEAYRRWFVEVCRKTADMIAHWMRVGFVHGVMNTDNMSILGLTIDYGPYGWLDDFDPGWTPNTTDAHSRRYTFGNQPAIAQWNLLQLAAAVYPLIGEQEPIQEALDGYQQRFTEVWRNMRAEKLGLAAFEPADEDLYQKLTSLLTAVETDMTIFFRRLADVSPGDTPPEDRSDDDLMRPIRDAYYRPEQLTPSFCRRTADWLRRYLQRLEKDGRQEPARRRRMNRANPKYILRNYMAQEAIEKAEQGDFSRIHELLDLLRRPYDEQPERAHFAAKRPDWARDYPGASMLSCSS